MKVHHYGKLLETLQVINLVTCGNIRNQYCNYEWALLSRNSSPRGLRVAIICIIIIIKLYTQVFQFALFCSASIHVKVTHLKA